MNVNKVTFDVIYNICKYFEFVNVYFQKYSKIMPCKGKGICYMCIRVKYQQSYICLHICLLFDLIYVPTENQKYMMD